MSNNPEELEVEDNPKRRRRKKRGKRSRRRSRSCHRVKGYKRCRKGGRRRTGRKGRRGGKSHMKRGRRLLTWKAAVKRHGVMGAKRYRAKYGIKKLKG